MLDWFMNLFKGWFTPMKSTTPLTPIYSYPKHGDMTDDVKILKKALNSHGYKLDSGNDFFGDTTLDIVKKFQLSKGLQGTGTVGHQTLKLLGLELKSQPNRPVNPAYMEAKKYMGKGENDSKFVKWLSGFWAGVGLPGYKTIIGSSFAWCALFIFAMNTEVGQEAISKSGAAARSWATYGVAIDWKKNGIPRGAVMHINGNGNCSSASGNHVTFADGDCTASELSKAGATVPGLGGNQSNQVKRSLYPVKNLCAVRWPKEIPKPGAVTTSINCAQGSASGESTR